VGRFETSSFDEERSVCHRILKLRERMPFLLLLGAAMLLGEGTAQADPADTNFWNSYNIFHMIAFAG